MLRFLFPIVVAWALVLILVRVFSARLTFFPDVPGRLSGDWNPRDLPIENVWLRTTDGIRLHAWWIPNSGSKFTFLAFHGNAGNIADRAEVYRFLRQLPANVLAVEYRGYGKSDGTPSEAGVYRDAEAGYQYLTEKKGIDPQSIVSFGQSLGTSVAAHLAADKTVGGIVLEAPFPSAAAVAKDKFWFLPGIGLVAGSQFDTRSKLARASAPVLIVHCTEDPVIPPLLAEQVYEAAHGPKSILRIAGYCHEEASLVSPAEYRHVLQNFLSQLARGAKEP